MNMEQHIIDQIKAQVWYQVWNHEVESKVRDQVVGRITDQVRIQVMYRIIDQVREQL